METVCVFGDSVAKGVILDSAKQKYTFLKQCCTALFAGKSGVQLDNFSKFGCTVTKGMQIVRRYTERLSAYNYVALEFGGNDCNYNWAEIAENPERAHAPQTPPPLFRETYGSLIDLIRKNGGIPVVVNLPPLDAEKFFRWVSNGLNQENILRWLGNDVEHIFRWHAGYNAAAESLAREKGAPLVDIRKAFLDLPDYSDLICADGMHPNERGHALISQAIALAAV